MPPASLSTLAVMMPGPITEATIKKRAQRDDTSGFTPDGVARGIDSAMQHALEHVVHGDDADELSPLRDRKREEVVLGGQLRHLPRGVLRREWRGVLVHDAVHRLLRRRNQQIAQREHAG